MTPPRSTFALLVTLSLAACGARTGLEAADDAPDGAVGAVAFPVGEYTDCAHGIFAPAGGVMGVDHDAVLSLTQSGSALHARYVDQNAARSEYDFSVTSGVTATLTPNGVASSGAPHPCVLGVGVVARGPTALIADEGALTVDRDTVFLVAQGAATDVTAGRCGVQSDRQSVWIACRRRDRAAPAGVAGTSVAVFPAGTFACQTQVATYVLAGGISQYAGNGATGSLSVMQGGSGLWLSYEGDRAASLDTTFTPTSPSTARAGSASGVSAACDVPISTPAATSVAPLSVSAGAIMLAGSSLFVSVAGTMNGDCAGAEKFVTLRCSRM